jgi:hypothetical protein
MTLHTLSSVLSLAFCLAVGSSALGSQDQAPNKPLNNSDVLDLLNSGLSQEIVIAKIKSSACEFDTAPSALEVLKYSKVPDVVILAMVEAPVAKPAVQAPVPAVVARVRCEGRCEL